MYSSSLSAPYHLFSFAFPFVSIVTSGFVSASDMFRAFSHAYFIAPLFDVAFTLYQPVPAVFYVPALFSSWVLFYV